jgi:alkylhydroperoxidase family enzyme
MAYVAFNEPGAAALADIAVPPAASADEGRLSALEWSVVALARRDTLGSLRHPSRLSLAMRVVLKTPNPRLADERLEALRRMAVLAWHHNYAVPGHEVKAFLAAGFSPAQYDTMMASLSAARASKLK